MDLIRKRAPSANADKVGGLSHGLRDLRAVDAGDPGGAGGRMIGVELPITTSAAEVEQACVPARPAGSRCGDERGPHVAAALFREDQARTAPRLFEETVADVENAGS